MLTEKAASASREQQAVLWLLMACALWGMSFNWNKEAQHILGQRLVAATGAERMEVLGPAAFLALRFPIAALLWTIVFPRSLRGWTWRTAGAGLAAGVLLATGMLLQHYGLAYTSESLSAFLTSLTVLFTPILCVLILGRHVGWALWASVACATLGVALMTLARDEGRVDIGALLGLLCAVVFSGHILVVDHFGRTEQPWRFTLSQFLSAGTIFIAFTLLMEGGTRLLEPRVLIASISDRRFLVLTALAIVFATLATFGIMFRFQPRTTPTRAALTYMTEPLFATGYAWLIAGRTITVAAMLGGLLIVLGNVLAELLGRRSRADEPPLPLAESRDLI